MTQTYKRKSLSSGIEDRIRNLKALTLLVLLHNLRLYGIEANPVDCDFEEDLCGWEVYTAEYEKIAVCRNRITLTDCLSWYHFANFDIPTNMPWTRIKAGDAKNFTSFKGFYPKSSIVMSSSNTALMPRIFIRGAINPPNAHFVQSFYLLSKEVPWTHVIQCFHYSYMLYGDAALIVAYVPHDSNVHKVLSRDVDGNSDVILHRNHTVEKYFQRMSIDLPVKMKFKIVFQSMFYNKSASYAMIDDVFIEKGPCAVTVHCKAGEFRCFRSEECISRTLFCDGKEDCNDRSDEGNCKLDNVIDPGSMTNPFLICNASRDNHKIKNGGHHLENDFILRTLHENFTGPGFILANQTKDNSSVVKKEIGLVKNCLNDFTTRKCNISSMPSGLQKCFQECPKHCISFSSKVPMKCVSYKSNFYHYFEWRNVLCDNVSFHELYSSFVYSLNIITSDIKNFFLDRTIIDNLQYLQIRDSTIETLLIVQGNKPSKQLQALQLINCTIKYAHISFASSSISNTLQISDLNSTTYISGLEVDLSFYDIYYDMNLRTNKDIKITLFEDFIQRMVENLFNIVFPKEYLYSKIFISKLLKISVVNQQSGLMEVREIISNDKKSFLPDKKLLNSDLNSYITMQNCSFTKISQCQINPNTVRFIDLSSNIITIIEKEDFKSAVHLGILILRRNRIHDIEDNAFKDVRSLFSLDLSDNVISYVKKHFFISLKNLHFLYLNNNKIDDIDAKAFWNLKKLITLDISNNKIRHFGEGLFLNMENLENLFLQSNEIMPMKGMFLGLFNLKYLYVGVFSLCCAKPRSIYDVECIAPQNRISSCEQLINVPVLSVVIWYMAFLATFGNIIAFLSNITTFKDKSSIEYLILSCNLSIADLFMGVYLYIIAIVNLIYTGINGLEDYIWRHSSFCTFAGILATMSSEASALFVLLITIDRCVAIKHPFSPNKRAWVIGSSVFSWVLSISIALFPILAMELSIFEDFYAQSPVCISLPLSVHRQNGWQYSMVIFIGFNFIIFVGISIGQFLIVLEVNKSGRKSQASNCRRREIALAKSVVAVVITDLLCWVPVGIIGMLTFNGIDVSLEVYAWIIVLVLPVNSALNPILYTLSVIIRDRGRRKVLESNMQRKIKMLTSENDRLKRRMQS